MRHIYCILVGIVSTIVWCFLLVSCNKEENVEKVSAETVSVDKTELTFTQKDESKELKISCESKWYLEADGIEYYYGSNMADFKDFIITPASGEGKTQITITLNNEPSASYNADLKIVEGDNHVIVKLKVVVN